MRKNTKVLRRWRRPGQLTSRVNAIRNHCLECVGYNSAEVERCTAPECWLWPYRFGYERSGESVLSEAENPPLGVLQDETGAKQLAHTQLGAGRAF